MPNLPIKNITFKYLTTKLLLILFFTLSVLDFLNIVNFSNLISLNSGFTIYGKEYWRLFLYPYVTNNLTNLIFISTIGVYVFIKLEKLVSKGSLFILFLFYSLMYGLTFTAATVQESISTSGLDSFFLFSLFLLSFIKKSDRYYPLGKDNQFFLEYANSKSKLTSYIKINKLTYFHFLASMLSLWLIKELSLFTFDANYNLFPSLTAITFALITSFLSHKKIFNAENEINSNERINQDANFGLNFDNEIIEELAPAVIESENKFLKSKKLKREDLGFDEQMIYFLFDENLTDEEKVDEILDRINLIGKDQISNEELSFLKRYSDK
ncbi:MAG: hypothetical protein ACOVNU_00240 [Candidatus Kapaibacteriota bacterium]|jgi:hypothetical protein